jgi:hypothetical protein
MHMVRQLPATTGMGLTFARTHIAEFPAAAFQVPFARRHSRRDRRRAGFHNTQNWNLPDCRLLPQKSVCAVRNVVGMFGGADKKFISKEQAFQRAVLS